MKNYRQENSELPTLIHFSTDEVYGDIVKGSHTESDILKPSNPYSATKAAAEHMIRAYQNTYGVEYMMVRPSNNFGPRQHGEKFLPTIIKKLNKGKKVPVYGTGKNVREWTYVLDTIKAIDYIMEKSAINEVYNISSNNEQQNLTIVKKVCEILGKDYDRSIEFVKDRLGHDFRYSVDADKLNNLGFKVDDSFEDNLLKTVSSYNAETK